MQHTGVIYIYKKNFTGMLKYASTADYLRMIFSGRFLKKFNYQFISAIKY